METTNLDVRYFNARRYALTKAEDWDKTKRLIGVKPEALAEAYAAARVMGATGDNSVRDWAEAMGWLEPWKDTKR